MSYSKPMLDVERRRLLWRATHRGIKEMDLLVGGYATAHLAAMDDKALAQFAGILEIPDQLLLSWATHQEAIPDHQRSQMLDDVLAFRPNPNSRPKP
jgi:antitoxin CptB